MRTLLKLLIAVVLVIVAHYVALKTYLYYQVRNSLQQFTQLTAPFVSVEYRAIGSNLWTGSVQVEEIKLRPVGINDTVSVASVSLGAGDLRRLLRVLNSAKDRKLPDSLQVALRDVKIDLNGDLMGFVERIASGTPRVATGSAHCDYQTTSSPAFLRKLGYTVLATDLVVNYAFNSSAQWLTLGTDLTLQDMSRIVMDIKLGGVQLESLQAMPNIRELRIVLRDLSYKERLKSYCARVAKISEADYITAELGPDSTFFHPLGINPGPGLQQAYREFLSKPGGEIEFKMQPSAGFEPASAGLYQPAELISMLNVAVRVNGKTVEDLSVSAAAPKPASPPASSTAAAAPPSLNPVKVPSPVPIERDSAQESSGFRSVRASDLPRYVNHFVRVRERGHMREGVLIKVAGNSVVIERQYGSGHVVVTVSLANIDTAEVQF